MADQLATEFPSWAVTVTMGGRVWSAERTYGRDRRWIIGGSGPELLTLMRERVAEGDR